MAPQSVTELRRHLFQFLTFHFWGGDFMRTNNPSIKYKYIVDILRTTSEEHTDLQNRLFSESRENARSFKSILHHKINDKPELIDDLWAFRKIASAIGECILRYHAPVSAKQRLYADLYALCKQIAQQRGIENYEAYLDVLPEPVSDGTTTVTSIFLEIE